MRRCLMMIAAAWMMALLLAPAASAQRYGRDARSSGSLADRLRQIRNKVLDIEEPQEVEQEKVAKPESAKPQAAVQKIPARTRVQQYSSRRTAPPRYQPPTEPATERTPAKADFEPTPLTVEAGMPVPGIEMGTPDAPPRNVATTADQANPPKEPAANRYVPQAVAGKPEPTETSEPAAKVVSKPADDGQAGNGQAGNGQADDGQSVLLSLQGPHLLSKTVGPRSIVIGRTSQFAVLIGNAGDAPANDVVVSVDLPEWVDVSASKPSHGSTGVGTKTRAGQKIEWKIGKLGAKKEERLVLDLVPRKSQALDLGVQWTHEQMVSRAQVEVQEPMLHMVISGPNEAVYGQTKLYNLTLSNPGTGDAENVVVQLLPLGGADESVATQSIGTLGRGQSRTIQIELVAGKAGTLVVKGAAMADGGLKSETSKEVIVRRAELKVAVAGPKAQYAGREVTYQLRVSNTGNATAEGVVVAAVLPEGADLVETGPKQLWKAKQGRLYWDAGVINAGQEKKLTLTTLLKTTGPNRLRVAAHDNMDLTASADVATNVIARADLKLIVGDPKGPVPVGEPAVYEVRIQNRGTKAAESIEAVVFFSEGIEPISVQGGSHEIGRGQVIFKPVDALPAGGELVFEVTAQADKPGNHVFRTEVLCRSLGTKLAAEETTHYYGDDFGPAASSAAPQIATRPGRKPVEPATIKE